MPAKNARTDVCACGPVRDPRPKLFGYTKVLRQLCELVEFLTSVKDVYEATPDSVRALRDTACTIAQKHLPQMCQDEDISTLYEQTLDEAPGFAKDLLKRYTGNSLYGYCTSCGPGQAMEVLQARCLTCRRGNTGGQSYYGP